MHIQKSASIFTIPLVLLTCIVLFITCGKEYSYEGGNSNGSSAGTAVYTLSGAGGACTGFTLTGNYYENNVLTAGNTIELEVNVTTIGTYSVSTNSSNGIHFSTTGTFTTTGIQTIVLTGRGTPSATGSFTYLTPVEQGCSFTITVTKVPPVIAAFTLAGVPNNCQNAVIRGTYVAGAALSNANTVDIVVNVSSPGEYALHTDTIDGISFSKAGTFTVTGTQTVTLMGFGAPDLPQNIYFTLPGGNSGCTFKVTVATFGPQGVYVIESGSGGSPGPCIQTLSGTYTSNIPLSGSNTISIRIYVDTPGNFTVSTQTVNGMTFSYTGTFTTTGAQYIILQGRGTPLASGYFLFIPEIVGAHPLGGESCSFGVTVL
jgi:hypothetical protein